MKVIKSYIAIEKGGIIYAAGIVGTPTEKDTGWHLEIQKQLSGGGFETVHSADYTSLFSAKKVMEKWRKGLKWWPSN